MADIFREIDEELRQERAEKLWRQYGKYAIGGAVAVVLAIAAYTGWQEYRTDRQLEAGAKFAAAKALAQEGKTGDAEALFAALGTESGTAYGVLARFHAAALRASSGDRAGAVLAFRALAGDDSIDRPMRDLATLLAAQNALDAPGADGQSIAADIDPLAQPGGAWRHLALETLGLIARSAGDPDRAKTYFQRIVDDAEAPPNVRLRASHLLNLAAGT